MADLEMAKVVLRGLRRDVIELPGIGFAVNFRDQFVVRAEDVDSYLAQKSEIKRPSETQLYRSGWYEHVVRFEGGGLRRPYSRDESLLIESPDGTRIEVSRPSTLFCLCLTDVDQLDRQLRRLTISPPGSRTGEERPLGDAFRVYTIKVTTGAETALGRSLQRMHDLAEAGIFHFAYGQGISISFTKSWERTYYWLGRKERETIQFPLRTYNSELVSYYNLALSSESLVLGYLALYKILEYFYTSVSENALHERIRELLVAPDFVHTKTKKLRELVKSIRQFDTRFR